MKNTHLTETRFSNLELSAPILRGLTEAGFKQCTPIQDKALPLSLRGKDIAGQAQTGTGKTATFLLATFQYLLNEVAPDEIDDEDEAIISWEALAENPHATGNLLASNPETTCSPVSKTKNPRAIIIAPTQSWPYKSIKMPCY